MSTADTIREIERQIQLAYDEGEYAVAHQLEAQASRLKFHQERHFNYRQPNTVDDFRESPIDDD
ncbi:hypothetical protein NF212_25220 [Parasalinivibrio latis]|uniref:hypothetical protein n=1 Tax=Parasalinivibrio latis TaxID=2952610 RepID=UPI0030E17F3C